MKLVNQSVPRSQLQLRALRLIAMAALPLGMLFGVTAQGQTPAADPNANDPLEACDENQSQDGGWNNEADTYTAYIAVALDGTPTLGPIQLPVHCGTTGGEYTLEKVVDGEDVEVTLPAFTIPDPDPDAAEDAPPVSALDALTATAGGATDPYSYELAGTAGVAAAGTHTFKLSADDVSSSEPFEFTIVVKNVPVNAPTFGADAAAAAGNVGAYSSKTVWANVTLPADLPVTTNDDTAPDGVLEEYTLEVKVVHGMGMMETTLGTRETVLVHDGTATGVHEEANTVVSLTIDINDRDVLTSMADSASNKRNVMVKARLVRSDDEPGQPDDSAYASVALTSPLPASPTIGTVSTGVSETWHLYGDTAQDSVDNSVFVVKPNYEADGTTVLTADSDPVSEPDIRGDTADDRESVQENTDDTRYSYVWRIVSDDKKVATVVANTDGDSLIADDLFVVTAGYEGSKAMEDTTITVTGAQVGCPTMDGPMDRCRKLREVIKIVVLKNRAPIFAVTEATIRWLENDAAQMVDLKADFVLPGVVQDKDEGQPLEFALLEDGEAIPYTDKDPCVEDVMISKTAQFYVTKDGRLGVSRSGTGCVNLGINFDVPGGESHELTVQASDGQGGTDVLTLTIDVRNVNEVPSVVRGMASYEAPALVDGVDDKTVHQFSVADRFTDPEDDALCYTLGAGASTKYFKVEGSGRSSCGLPNFTITLISPSVDADTPAPGHTNVETHMFEIGVTEASGDNKLSSKDMVEVTVRGVYGQNLAPLIWGGRADDSVTNAPYLSEWEVDENSSFSAVFTAQDVQPTNDRLCFSLPPWGSLTFNPGRHWYSGATQTALFTKCMNHEDDEPGVFKATVYDYRGFPRAPSNPLDYEGKKGMISSNLTVTDLSGVSAKFSFKIMLKDVPEGPVQTKALPPRYGVVGDEPITIDLNTYFSDGDGDELKFTPSTSDRSVVPTVSDGVLTLTLSSGDISEKKEATINLEVSDPTQQRIYASFMVTLKNENEAPMFDNAVTAVTWTVAENSSSGTAVGAAMTATDKDKDDVSYDLEQSKECEAGTGTADCFSIDKGQVKVAGRLNHEYKPMHMITLVAKDKFGGASYLEATIEVSDVNEKPTLEKAIKDQQRLVGVGSCFDANAHFHDVDARDQAAGLLFETSINRRATASVEVEKKGNMIWICVTGLEPGNAVATVTATDRGSEKVRDRFKVTVVENQMPTVVADGIGDMTVQENGRTADIDLSGVFDDGDPDYTETLTYAVSVANETFATATLVGNDDMLRIYGDMKGSTEVTVTATDQNDNMVSDMFTVTVEKNEPPVPGMVADVMTRVGLPPMEVSLDNAFTDDGDTFTMVASTDNAQVATAAVIEMADGSNVVRVHEHSAGSTGATIIATDSIENTAEVSFTIVVGERNDSPTVIMEVKDQIVEVHSAIVIDLDEVFTDPDGDKLKITVDNESEAIADVVYRESRNEIRIYGNMSGETNVAVTATDNVMYNSSPMVEFNVLANDKPIVANAISEHEMIVGHPYQISISDVFEDPDAKPGDMLKLDVAVSDDAHVTAKLEDGSLHIDATAPVVVTISITATDVHGSHVTDQFELTAINLPPVVVMDVDDQELVVNHDAEMVSLEGVFGDPNLLPGEMLSIVVKSEDEAVVKASIDQYESTDTKGHPGDVLTLTAVYPGKTMVTLTATDMFDASVSFSFMVTVVNLDPTVVNELSDKMIVMNHGPEMLSLEGVFADGNLLPDEKLSLTAASSDEAVLKVSIEGEHLTITEVNPGEVTVTVTATDMFDGSVSFSFKVAVVNLPPMVAMELPDQDIVVNHEPVVLSLADAFEDANLLPEEMLSLVAESSDDSVATANVDGKDLTLTPVMPGEANVTVTATDMFEGSVSFTFMVSVINLAPTVAMELPDQTIVVHHDAEMLSLAGAFEDGNLLPDEMLSLSAESADTMTVDVNVEGEELTLSAAMPGETMVTVTATDMFDASASFTFNVTVINLGPMVAQEIDPQSVTIAFPLELSLAGTFTDPNLGPDETLMLSGESANEGIASVAVSDEMMTITGILPGTVSIMVSASDQYGASVSTSFELTVVNLAPIVVNEIDSQVVTVGMPITVSLTGVFSDPNARPGETLTLSTSSGDTSLATVALAAETLTISGINPGTVMITVTATDLFGASVDELFDVKVETMPEAVGTIATVNLQVGGDSHQINLSQYFIDRDGETMTYTSSVSGSAARVSITGSSLTVSAYSKGSASVTVTATDPANRSAQQSFGVMVSDSNLKDVANEALAGYARTLLSSVSSAIGSRLESNRMDKGLNLGTLRTMQNVNAISGGALSQSGSTASNGSNSFGLDPVSSGMTVGSSIGSSVQSGTAGIASDLGSAIGLPSFNTRDFSKTLNGNGGVGSWSVWGAFDTQNFEAEGYEGSGTNLFLGVDVQTNECWLFGVSIARNSGDTDYTSGSATQTMETSLTTILPYFNYEYDDNNEAWGVLGRGSGDLETSVVNLANETADLTLNVGMLGGRKSFSSDGNFELALRGDVAFADLSTPDGSGSAEGLSAGVNRLRLGIEGSLSTDTGEGGSFEPYGELGLRNDGGDGFTGTGVEVAGGVRMSTDLLNIDVRGRTLVSHTAEGFKESGISLAATLSPSANGSGLSLTLMPSWGTSTQSDNVMWTEHATLRTLSGSSAGGYHMSSSAGQSIDSQLGYGILVDRDRYLLTTYINYRTDSFGTTAMVYGAEFRPGVGVTSALEMRLEVGQVTDQNQRKDNQLGLTAQMRF